MSKVKGSKLHGEGGGSVTLHHLLAPARTPICPKLCQNVSKTEFCLFW